MVASKLLDHLTWNDYIVTCHLPRGSKLRWLEDMGGGLPNRGDRALAEASNLLGYKQR